MTNHRVRTSPVRPHRLQNAFYAVALLVLIAVTLYWGQVILVPLSLAALFAFVLSTPARWLEKKGMPRVPSVLLVTLGAFGILAALVTVAVNQFHDLVADLPHYESNIDQKIQPIESLLHRIRRLQSNISQTAPQTTQPAAPDQPKPVVVQPPQVDALSWLPSLARPLVEIFFNLVLVIVLTVFMLMQRETFRDRLIRLAGRSRLSSTTRALDDAAARVGKYLLLQLCINAILGTVVAFGLYLLGVPYAPLFGLLVTMLRFVPYVGYWIAGISAIAMSAAVTPGWSHPLYVLIMFAAFDLLMANVIEPLVFSHGTGVAAVALLIAAVFWAFLWGPVGLLLSTPLTVCLAVIGEHVPALGFLKVLLGDEPSLDPASRYYNRVLARDYDEAAVILDDYNTHHPPAATYDEVILPALAQAKTDREQDDIPADEEHAVYDATRELLRGLIAHNNCWHPTAPEAAHLPPVQVIGCPVAGDADRIALDMLRDAICPKGEVVVTPPNELVGAVEKAGKQGESPAIVCLATLSPGGLTQARGLLADVRRAHPKTKLLVGRWGQHGDTAQTDRFLRASGADNIGWTLRQTIEQLLPSSTRDSPAH
jgi:predicted PurR-regulated permease PerM